MENLQWDKEEIKTLFKFVEIKKSEGVPLIKIFDQFATFTQRQQNSVRNFYYKNLAMFNKNENIAKNLQINIKKHIVNKVKPFSEKEEVSLIKQIDNLIEKDGISVRKACLILSGYEVNKMIRLQNKYRSLKQKINQKDTTQMGEIIKMPQTKTAINDEDIKALFMGLIKLVQKQEQSKIEDYYKKELFTANQKLKQAMAKLIVKENEIDILQKKLLITNENLQTQKIKLENANIKLSKHGKNAKNIMDNFFEIKKRLSSSNNTLTE